MPSQTYICKSGQTGLQVLGGRQVLSRYIAKVLR